MLVETGLPASLRPVRDAIKRSPHRVPNGTHRLEGLPFLPTFWSLRDMVKHNDCQQSRKTKPDEPLAPRDHATLQIARQRWAVSAKPGKQL